MDISYSTSLKEIQAFDPTLSTEEVVSFLTFEFSSELENKLYDLMFFANLARPGSIELFEGDIYVDDQKIRETKRITSHRFYNVAYLANEEEWPRLESLPVVDVWRWGSTVEGLSRGFSDGPTGRALNALTHLCSIEDSQPFDLFWALMGLEAIYVRGRSNVMEQLREKVRALLGTPKTYKKRFSKMYEIRSRLIHGQLDFSSAHSDVEGPKHDEFFSDIEEATDMAVASLLATVQEHVKRNWQELNFSYLVDGTS